MLTDPRLEWSRKDEKRGEGMGGIMIEWEEEGDIVSGCVVLLRALLSFRSLHPEVRPFLYKGGEKNDLSNDQK